MAKFLKSIFHPTDRKKTPHYENEGEDDRSEPGSRRQLSISRSGRMKQANKKRHSLTLELYGDTIQIDAVEKPTSMEYYVHSPSHTAPADLGAQHTRLGDNDEKEIIHPTEQTKDATFDPTLDTQLRKLSMERSPEEEIDSAFEVIDKS